MEIKQQKTLQQLFETFSLVFILPSGYTKEIPSLPPSELLLYLAQEKDVMEVLSLQDVEEEVAAFVFDSSKEDKGTIRFLTSIHLDSIIVLTPRLDRKPEEEYYDRNFDWYT